MKNYSIYFQLKNDIKDLISDKNNGNYTLAMLYFLRENKIEDLKSTQLDKYIEMANEKIGIYRDNAILPLSLITNSKYKDALLKIVDLSL